MSTFSENRQIDTAGHTKEDFEMDQKLKVSDFIMIGVLSAVAVVLFFVLGSLIGSTPVGWLFTYAILAIPLGIVYMLMYSKVRKNYVVLISGLVICALMLMNFWLVPAVLFAVVVINELIWRASSKGFRDMMLAHCIFMTGWAVAAFLPLLVMKESFIAQYGDAYRPYYEAVYQTLAGPMFILVIVATAVGAIIGSYIGKTLLKKNFEKAGIV